MFLVENVAYEHAPCTHTEHNQCDLAAVFREPHHVYLSGGNFTQRDIIIYTKEKENDNNISNVQQTLNPK